MAQRATSTVRRTARGVVSATLAATVAAAVLAATMAPGRAAAAHVALGADGFVLVNRSGSDLADLQVRRSGGGAWRALSVAVRDGASATVAFADPDCAFDLRATAATGEVVWSGVNLCEVDAVILQRRGATPWVDYQ